MAEYNGSTILRRYAHGPGVDEPIVWYEGATLATKRWLHPDERGSVVAWTDSGGAATVYQYGPYGEPTSWDVTSARFRYTGQIQLPEVGLYHYKARAYDPSIGRFLQTDPVGYQDDFNVYAYVYNDAINRIDPAGTESAEVSIWAVCSLSGSGSCGPPPHDDPETTEAFATFFPGATALLEYERGNTYGAVALGAIDALSLGKGKVIGSLSSKLGRAMAAVGRGVE